MIFVILVAAAFCLGLGFVLQQHAASQAPSADLLRFRLLLHLLRKPVWLAGVASMVVGQVLGGLALGEADVTLVEPVLTVNLLFALMMSQILFRVPINWREWGGAIMLTLGVTAFIVAGQPRGGNAGGGAWESWLTVFVIAGVAVMLVAGGIHRNYRQAMAEKATLLALSAGLLYGIQDGLTKHALHVADTSGVVRMFLEWSPYALLGVGITSMLIAQSAFEAAPLRMSLPAITAAEPVAGIAVGVAVFHERVDLGPLNLAFEVAGLVAMVAGVLVVGRSPLLDQNHHHFRERRDAHQMRHEQRLRHAALPESTEPGSTAHRHAGRRVAFRHRRHLRELATHGGDGECAPVERSARREPP